MADLYFRGVITSVTSGTTVPKTFIQLVAAANHRVRLLDFTIAYQGTSVTATPHVWQFVRQTTAGTASALTLVKEDDSVADSILTTAQQTFTAEPTLGDILEEHVCHTQSGLIKVPSEIKIGGGDRLGLRLLEAAAAADVTITLRCEE